jgi:RNA polymerase sigma factor (sigma-70 family)
MTELAELTARSASNPESELVSAEAWDAFVDVLAELPSNQRDVFVMNEMEGISFREISELTGEKLNTLLARKHRAVRYLRKRLAHFEQEFKD